MLHCSEKKKTRMAHFGVNMLLMMHHVSDVHSLSGPCKVCQERVKPTFSHFTDELP